MSLTNALLRVVRTPIVGKVSRTFADWIDLMLSHHIAATKLLAPYARGRMLDVGCGEKPYAEIFAPFVDEYLGIEHESTFTLTDASNRTRGPDLRYDGKRLPFDDDTFDTVGNFHVLEHTPDPDALVGEMARVLKPGGALLVAVPFSFRLHEEPHDYFRYTPRGLEALCGRHGLKLERVESLGRFWSVVGHKLNSFLVLRVAHLDGLGQVLGKFGHEGATVRQPRLGTLPFVLPLMVGFAGAARVLDRVAPDDTESLGYFIVARKPVE
jgi:SAM-dependent methyltransferase